VKPNRVISADDLAFCLGAGITTVVTGRDPSDPALGVSTTTLNGVRVVAVQTVLEAFHAARRASSPTTDTGGEGAGAHAVAGWWPGSWFWGRG
jgi:hypothetical protein